MGTHAHNPSPGEVKTDGSLVLKTIWPSPLGENQVNEALSSNKQTIRRYIPEKWASKVASGFYVHTHRHTQWRHLPVSLREGLGLAGWRRGTGYPL